MLLRGLQPPTSPVKDSGIASWKLPDEQCLPDQQHLQSASLPLMLPCLLPLETALLQLQPVRLVLQQLQHLQFEMLSPWLQPLQPLVKSAVLCWQQLKLCNCTKMDKIFCCWVTRKGLSAADKRQLLET